MRKRGPSPWKAWESREEKVKEGIAKQWTRVIIWEVQSIKGTPVMDTSPRLRD